MTQPNPTPQAKVRKSRLHLSFAWLVPVIAALVGGFLFYRSEIDVGPTIEIAFQDGTSITKGSKVVYRGVEVGMVQSVELDSSLNHVDVTAQLRAAASGLVREGSQFWIVEPRVSVGEVTGLETLLSGSYIQVAPGGGAEAKTFQGLANPPAVTASEQDLPIFLETDDAASLVVGSPVSYRGISVGTISAIDLPGDGSRVQLEVAIAAKHAGLVRTNSTFWLTSGVHFDLQPLDPTIDISSVESLIRGGVAFATPGQQGAPASANAVFELLDSPPGKGVLEPNPGVNYVLSAAALGSIQAGDPVYYREVKVGEVTATGLETDAAAAQVHVRVWQRFTPLVQEGTMFWNASGLHLNVGLFSGATLDLESLAALLAGGVAFATPDTGGAPAKEGSQFALHDQPKDDWLQWKAVATLGPTPSPTAATEGFEVQPEAAASYTVKTASHVRAGPDTTYPVLITLDAGSAVEVTGKVQDRDWYRIKLGDGFGYIWGNLVEPAQTSASQ